MINNINMSISSEEKSIATLNDKYSLIKKVGKGATSTVYLGYDTKNETKELFAFKVMNSTLKEAEYSNEESILSEIDNSNVIHLIEGGRGILKKQNGKSSEVNFLKLEYLEHGELFDFVFHPRKGFGENLGRLIMNSILNGLEAIHKKGFVHRDLKTENIMVDSTFNLKIADFGFATTIEGKKKNGLHSVYLGTLAYAAPELLMKTPYYGTTNDVFSFGIIMFVIVTGTMPFRLSVPNDQFYNFIYRNDYDSYWKRRGIKLSDQFISLFNSLIAYEPTQRASLAEIRKSDWITQGDYSSDNYKLLKEDFSKRLLIIQKKNKK